MSTTADYLAELIAQKNALAQNLAAKGVTAAQSERFNTLVPKVLELPYNAVAGEWTPPEDTTEMIITDSMPFTPSVFSVNGLAGMSSMLSPTGTISYLINGGYNKNAPTYTGHFIMAYLDNGVLVTSNGFTNPKSAAFSVYEGGFSIRNWTFQSIGIVGTFRGGVTYQWMARA